MPYRGSAHISDNAAKGYRGRARAAAAVSVPRLALFATTLAGKIVGEALNDDERSARVVGSFLVTKPRSRAGAAGMAEYHYRSLSKVEEVLEAHASLQPL